MVTMMNVSLPKNKPKNKIGINYFTFRAISKAVDAAINSRQWAKAVQILELQDSSLSSKYYKKIADHYASIGEYEVSYGLFSGKYMGQVVFLLSVKYIW